MRFAIAAVALLATACTPPATKTDTPPASSPSADAAGNRMEALSERDGRWCTGDGAWCVAVSDGAAVVMRGDTPAASIPAGEAHVWPQIIRVGREDVSVLVGLVNTESQMYSGGSGTAEQVALYDVASGRATRQVLTFPLSGNLSIRACFTEEQTAARRDACADEYDFAGTLALDPSVAEGAPRFVLTTEATTYPGHVSRSQDSTERPPLQQSDLVRWRDDTCSYRRVAARQGDAYVWDAALPACSDYLEP